MHLQCSVLVCEHFVPEDIDANIINKIINIFFKLAINQKIISVSSHNSVYQMKVNVDRNIVQQKIMICIELYKWANKTALKILFI